MTDRQSNGFGGRQYLAKASLFLAIGMILGFGTVLVRLATSVTGWMTRPASWDQAVHALDAMHFAKAFVELDVQQFLDQLHNSALWPPVIPLIQSVYLMFTDIGYGGVRTSIVLFAVLACVLTFVAGIKLDRIWGFAIGLTASAFLFLSPGYLDYTVQEMLEVPGICLSLVTFILYMTYLDRGEQRFWRYTVVSATVLFFAKFNYAIMVFLPIIVTEVVRKARLRHQLWESVQFVRRDIQWTRPFSIFVYAYLLFLVYVRVVGIHFEAFGQIVTIKRAFGNPLYLLVAIVLLRMALFHRKSLQFYFKAIWWAPSQMRPVVRYFVLPAAIWMLYPPFFSTFFIFLFSESTRKQSFFSMETLTFYPGAFVNYYAFMPMVGYLLTASLLYMLVTWRRHSIKLKFLMGLVCFNLFLIFMHPNYQERYMLTIVPYMFLAGCYGLYTVVGQLLKPWPMIATWGSRLAGFALFIGLVSSYFPTRDYLQQRFYRFSNDPSFAQFAERICYHAYKSEENAIVGLSGYLNPAAIAVACYEIHPDMKRSQLPTTMTRLGFHGYLDGKRVVDSKKIGQFFVADYSQAIFDVGRQQEAHLLPGARAEIPASEDYKFIETIIDTYSGIRMSVYRRQQHDGLSSAKEGALPRDKF